MLEQESFFDPDPGATLRDEALDRVELNADERWILVARGILVQIATRNSRFTADDVAEKLLESVPEITTHEPRAMGAVFRWAHREKIAEPTPDYVPTRRAQGHKGPRRVWKSLIA